MLWDGEIAVVVNKPAGLPTQAPVVAESLETRLRAQFAQRSDYLAFPHRLDRPVGGLILVALTKKAARLLTEQFMARKVQKDYLAIVAGRVEGGASVWIDQIRKITDQARAEVVSSSLQPNSPSETEVQAKLAETAVEIIRYDERSDRTLLRLSPVTGRMHQLRVQAASRGFPIIGDVLYGGPALQGGPERILLQAHRLRFFDPRDSRPVTVTASDIWTESV